jgi:hypothetical protein
MDSENSIFWDITSFIPYYTASYSITTWLLDLIKYKVMKIWGKMEK